jgi:hypothetical protein
MIPLATKTLHPSSVHYLFGDMPVILVDQTLVMDLSLLNEFKAFRDLQAVRMYTQKVLVIKVEDRGTRDFSAWTRLVTELRRTQNSELMDWARVIQTYCQKYQRILGRQCRKKPKSDLRRNYFMQVNEDTEKKKKELFENYPCIQTKYRLKNHQNQLTEILINEMFIKDLGYNVESFADTILSEGIPQIMSNEYNTSSRYLRTLFEKYFTLGPTNNESPELESLLSLRHGYVRPIRYKVHYLMNYENNSFGIDMIISIVAKGEPFMVQHESKEDEINSEFLLNMTEKEKESEYFLNSYYSTSFIWEYTNLSRICKIKELAQDYENDFDDTIIVKKYEDES